MNDLSLSVRVWVSRAQDAFASASFANSADANALPPSSLLFVATDLGTMTEAETLKAAVRDHDDEDDVVTVSKKAKASVVIVVIIPPARRRMVTSSIGIFGGDHGIYSGGATHGEG